MLHTLRQERTLELWEGDADLGRILGVAFVDQTVEIARQAFVGSAQFGGEGFRPTREIAVLIGQAEAETEVAFAVGSFQFGGYALFLVSRQMYECVEKARASVAAARFHLYVYEFHNREASESLVGTFDRTGAVFAAGLYVAHVVEYLWPQIFIVAVHECLAMIIHRIG